MAYHTIEAHNRSVTGKHVKALRRSGLLPANVYGHNVPSKALQIDAATFSRLETRLSANSLVDLKVEGGTELLVMINHIQHDALTGRAKHIEFFQVNLLERLTATVPLVITGISEAVEKNESLVLLHELEALEVSCLPGDLPLSIKVACGGLAEAGDTIFVRDLAIDRTKIEVRSNEDARIVSLAASHAAPLEETVSAAEPAASAATEGATTSAS